MTRARVAGPPTAAPPDHTVRTASATLRNLEWFQVSEIRGHISGNAVGHYQVVMKLGFRYDKG